jgi:lipid II:glycine glycyltransferase (peptidoglycan interpeptide bridge formation enzyme)
MSSDPVAGIREATPDELAAWDAHVVPVPGGDVYQSSAWAGYRSRHGWRPRFLLFPDGFRLLALERPWPLIGGSGAYLSKGPIRAGEPPERTAERLVAASRWLAGNGVDVVASDTAMPVGLGYAERLAKHGFRSIEEIQPSRHRMAIDLAGRDDAAVMAAIHPTTRRWIRDAVRAGLRVVRHDARMGSDPGDGFEAPDADDAFAASAAFGRLYDVLVETAARRRFHLGARPPFLDWCATGYAAGLIVLLEVLDPDGMPLGAAMFYRHGDRLTFSHGGDRAVTRERFRGVAHLQQWRAIQLAIREGRREMDLAGVDVRGARYEPGEGDPKRGLWRFKRSLGAEWVEQVGNLQWVAHPWRYRLGRVALGVSARLAR